MPVRIAWAVDAAAIAALQVAVWRERYAGSLPPDVLQELPVDAFTERWQRAIVRPSEARQRVLVALDAERVVGFVAAAPATDADAHPGRDAEVTEFAVRAGELRSDGAFQLLHAVVDTLRSDRFTRATLWLTSTDDSAREFFSEQGWAPDGGHRELDLYGDGSVTVKQVRLHTDIAVPE